MHNPSVNDISFSENEECTNLLLRMWNVHEFTSKTVQYVQIYLCVHFL